VIGGSCPGACAPACATMTWSASVLTTRFELWVTRITWRLCSGLHLARRPDSDRARRCHARRVSAHHTAREVRPRSRHHRLSRIHAARRCSQRSRARTFRFRLEAFHTRRRVPRMYRPSRSLQPRSECSPSPNRSLDTPGEGSRVRP